MRTADASYIQTVGRIAGILAVLALAGCGGAESQAPSVSTPDDIVALMDTPRLTSISSKGNVVTAEGQASTAEGDSLRTEWFTTVGGIEYVQRFGGSTVVPTILVGTNVHQADAELVGTLTDAPTFLSEDELRAQALHSADAAGVILEELNYVPFFGGTAEFVLRPIDESEFMKEYDERMSRFFGFVLDLPSPGRRPVLVTIVDSEGANRVIQGSVPLSDEGTTQYARVEGGRKVQIAEGAGMAWQADGLTVLGGGATERVEEAPGP
jgi:hypothetical protein